MHKLMTLVLGITVIFFFLGLWSWAEGFATRHYLGILLTGSAATFFAVLGVIDAMGLIPTKSRYIPARVSRALTGFLDWFMSKGESLSDGAYPTHQRPAAVRDELRVDHGRLGNSDFMSEPEMMKMSEKGNIILGQLRDDPRSPLVSFPLKAHAITVAGSRTGKGVSAIATNMLASARNCWKGPMITIDPKPEAFFIAAEARSKLRRQVVLGPHEEILSIAAQALLDGRHVLSVKSDTLNPMDLIRTDQNGVRDLNAIVDPLFVPGPNGADHWDTKGREWLVAVWAWVKAREPAELQHPWRAYELMTMSPGSDDEPGPLMELIQRMSKDEEAFFGLPAKAAAALLISDMKERTGIFSSALKAMDWIKDPYLREHTKRSSFDIFDICRDKIDITITVPQSLLADNQPTRLWVRMIASLPSMLIERMKPKRRILLILDEAADVGRLAPVISAFRQGAGRGLSIWLFTQTLAGLRSAYGDKIVDDMLGNAEFLQFLRPPANPASEVRAISEAIGNYTYRKHSVSKNKGTNRDIINPLPSGASAGSGTSVSEEQMRLMQPEDLTQMLANELVVVHRSDAVTRPYPIRLFQARYFERPELAGLYCDNPHSEAPTSTRVPAPLPVYDAPVIEATDAAAHAVPEQDLLGAVNQNLAAWIEDRFGAGFVLEPLTEDQLFSLTTRGELLEADGITRLIDLFDALAGERLVEAAGAGATEAQFVGDDLTTAELRVDVAEAEAA